ncbi:MAG: ornithine carbamoyltransferase subunit F, partial [Haemophilus parainfluenzae]|nr:ornithine carbamoyltransferase subunit F [Haemophilus parainfluenzae]
DEFHPTQMLADVLTMIEHCDKPLRQISYVYIGDARNNMGNSLLLIGSKLGMDVRICGPKALLPEASFIEMCKGFAKESGARITVTEDIDKAVSGVDFVHTDVWVSMGEPLEAWRERIKLLLPYCLPAFHNSETQMGRQIAEKYPELANGIEVTEDVFESPMNIAFEQAENRMHTIKAVMVASLA